MPRFPKRTPSSAVGASRELLGDLMTRHGRLGDMVSTMAHSPALLDWYLQLNRAMRRTKLDRKIVELISIAVQARQGCDRCLRSHIAAAQALGVYESTIEAARQGTSPIPAIAAIIQFGLQVSQEPAAITDAQIAELRSFGYSTREIADVVGVVSLNVLTGAFTLVAGLTRED
ncbi:carboxymuconolactone decarboxylase family protein [Leucobacter sp. wl10]|uniref:carboxymuconolactone decarboxylase family protein n=1 Tax=Leucobacter sp. wl10 TaxID=2304677 RepID=UPI000E5B95E0|nr:carboxymuconolactone decarboxylase family protein [Leucobacter sp. wl10]RGE19053.1 alkylhydroperoxidase [Leucobacter sp. wl10]